MEAEITFRDMNLNVFAGRPIPHVLFQPRLVSWYEWHRIFGTLPEKHQNLSLLELHDDLQVSMRYMHRCTGIRPVARSFSSQVQVHERYTDREKTLAYETPYGALVEGLRRMPDGNWWTVEFPVKGPDDLKKLRWLYQHTTWSFSADTFDRGRKLVGRRSEPQFTLPKSPYRALAQNWMKLEHFIYALEDHPGEVEETMRPIDESYDQLYSELIACGRVKIVSFDENIHAPLLSPRHFERYLIPYYEKRAGSLREAGICTHVHMDGFFRPLLRYLKHLPFDGYEALTPLPQGDVTLEEIKDHIGDKVLLDGIPAIFFLPTFSRQVLMETVEQIVALFHPRLVLGVSDELPQGADEEGIERVRMISEWCRNHKTE